MTAVPVGEPTTPVVTRSIDDNTPAGVKTTHVTSYESSAEYNAVILNNSNDKGIPHVHVAADYSDQRIIRVVLSPRAIITASQTENEVSDHEYPRRLLEPEAQAAHSKTDKNNLDNLIELMESISGLTEKLASKMQVDVESETESLKLKAYLKLHNDLVEATELVMEEPTPNQISIVQSEIKRIQKEYADMETFK